MQKTIQLQKHRVAYTVRKHRRAKRMRVVVYCDGTVVVTVPRHMSSAWAEQFLLENAHWVLEKLEQFRTAYVDLPRYTTKDYQQNKQRALQFVRQKVQEFNRWYGYKVNNISVKNQKTRWGSCSGKGNLNFNYKILFLPEDVASYIIVHELCHLKEFNHSSAFWGQVEQVLPNYRELRQELETRDFVLQ